MGRGVVECVMLAPDERRVATRRRRARYRERQAMGDIVVTRQFTPGFALAACAFSRSARRRDLSDDRSPRPI